MTKSKDNSKSENGMKLLFIWVHEVNPQKNSFWGTKSESWKSETGNNHHEKYENNTMKTHM